jgi:hypothetical protein
MVIEFKGKVVAKKAVRYLLWDDPFTSTAGDVPVDYTGTFVTTGPATLVFTCTLVGVVQQPPVLWVNPSLYVALAVTPQQGP